MFPIRQALFIATLALATSAAAQPALTPQQMETVERFVGPPVDEALRLCLAPTTPDLARLEAGWTAAGWPAFENERGARISKIPPGDRQLMSLVISSEPINGDPAAGTLLTCVLVVPTPFQPAMDEHLTAKFGSTAGAFYLEGENLSRVDLAAVQPGDLTQLLQSAPEGQQAVLLSAEQTRGASMARIFVLHRAS